MNIIYLLENKNKTTGERFYLGSKVSCYTQVVDGVTYIINSGNGKRYLSSSTNNRFWQDVKLGHLMDATVLEVVKKRGDILDREAYWLNKYNVADNPEFYNLSNMAFPNKGRSTKTKTVNCLLETYDEYASNKSAMSKRDASANNLGFSHFGELYMHIANRHLAGENFAEISNSFGKSRSFARMYVRSYPIAEAIENLNSYQEDKDKIKAIRDLFLDGCSLQAICKHLNISLPVGRILLGDYAKSGDRTYLTALRSGLTKKELEGKILNLFLEGKGIIEISKDLSLNSRSVTRYLHNAVRSRLRPSES